MADFIYIDGVEYRPDKELIEKIKEHFKKKESTSPFRKAILGGYYFFIGDDGLVHREVDVNDFLSNTRYACGNYCLDNRIINIRLAEENLLRKMWRFSLENDGDKIDWKNNSQNKYYLWFYPIENEVRISSSTIAHYPGLVYFNSFEIAEEARQKFRERILEIYGTNN